MPLPLFAALSAAGGLGLWAVKHNTPSAQPLVTQLSPSPLRRAETAQQPPDAGLNAGQHLALSSGLLGSAALGSLGVPLLHVVSLSGLIYLSGYFVYRGIQQWHRTHRVTIETNDAVLATGLLLTGQVGAGALFATLYFTSRKLEEAGDAALEHFADEDALFDMTAADMPKEWQGWIDQGALPLLALSAVSTPFLGFGRAISVLVANFAYDYRLVMPLGTIHFLRTAQAQEIHIRNAHVFELLQQTDVLVVDTTVVDDTALTAVAATPGLLVRSAASDQAAAVIAAEQAVGRTVAYFHLQPQTAAKAGADVVVACPQDGASLDGVHVVLPVERLADLFALATSLDASRRRGLALALAPSILNLSGIFLWRFGPLTALLVDYAGLGAGVLNALWMPREQPERAGALEPRENESEIAAYCP